MSRRHRLGSGRRYEELLDGARSDDSALSGLLDAARAPAAREEMSGLATARNAFMSVPYVRTRPAASVSKLPAATRTAAGRLLALKLVAAISGVTLVGGAAYAATGADLLGGGPQQHSPSSPASSAPHHRGGFQVAPGQAGPTPAGPLPKPGQATHGDGSTNSKSSIARSEHPPANPSNPPGRNNTSGPPDSHSPQPRHTPSPHNTNPHPTDSARATPTPGPHTTAAAGVRVQPTTTVPTGSDS